MICWSRYDHRCCFVSVNIFVVSLKSVDILVDCTQPTKTCVKLLHVWWAWVQICNYFPICANFKYVTCWVVTWVYPMLWVVTMTCCLKTTRCFFICRRSYSYWYMHNPSTVTRNLVSKACLSYAFKISADDI